MITARVEGSKNPSGFGEEDCRDRAPDQLVMSDTRNWQVNDGSYATLPTLLYMAHWELQEGDFCPDMKRPGETQPLQETAFASDTPSVV